MKKLLLAIILLIATVAANAWEILGVDSVNVTATYIEPIVNSDGSPITDLDYTIMYYDIGSGPVAGVTEPAGSPTGGTIKTVVFPVPVAAGQEADVVFFVTAFDTSGNESVQSTPITRRIDRLAPAAPQ